MKNNRPLWYDLDHNPISAEQAEEVLKSPQRGIAMDRFPDDWLVSTVFLVLDHNWTPEGPPILYETMVFNSSGEAVAQQRYATAAEAIAGHDQLVAAVRDKDQTIVRRRT